jgi:hypothetical protein
MKSKILERNSGGRLYVFTIDCDEPVKGKLLGIFSTPNGNGQGINKIFTKAKRIKILQEAKV